MNAPAVPRLNWPPGAGPGAFVATLKCGDKEIVMTRGCDIAGRDVVSQVELLRLKRETAVWLHCLQQAASEMGIAFVAGAVSETSRWLPEGELGRRMVELVIASMPEADRNASAMLMANSAVVYLSYWMGLLAEIGVQPIRVDGAYQAVVNETRDPAASAA